jgi:NAD+ synthase
MESYKFNPEQAFNTISDHWKKWATAHGMEQWVVGISGGVDSSVTAALAAKIFGYDNVLGVLMPNGEQKDIEDAKDICRHLKIEWCTVNIGRTYEELLDEVVFGALRAYGIERASTDTITNMPARLRMTALYAIAQSTARMVLNTCNLSESTVGYDTLWGDDAGSYAPIQGLTKTEVIALGDWLGLPHNFTHKTPIDGLQPKTDEEKLGFTYADLDRYIREDIGTPELKAKVDDLYRRNKFKTDMIHIDGPNFYALANFVRYNNLPDAEKTVKQAFADNLDIVRLEPEPRYPEDAWINGERDDNDNPKMPFMVADEKAQNGWVWKLDVNIKTGEVIGWPKDVKAEVHYKVCDCCRIKYNGEEYYEYVPDFLEIDDEGYGDYIILTIDDGKIVNWSESDCRKFINDVLFKDEGK